MNDQTCDKALTISDILKIDCDITSLSAEDMHGFGRQLHDIAERFMKVDACYFCLWDSRSNMLTFPYNFDIDLDQSIDSPCMLIMGSDPLGAGPTSRVIRSKSSYILDPADRTIQDGGVVWGRPSESAMHVPVSSNRDGAIELYGVFSVQSYSRGMYSQEAISFTEWLGRKAGQAIANYRKTTENGLKDCEITRLQEELTKQEVILVNAFVSLFPELNEAIATLGQSRHFLTPEQRHGIMKLSHISQKIQAQATCLHFSTQTRNDGVTGLQTHFTPREQEIVPLLAAGMSNKQIAELLYISVNTVKFHVGNILINLDIQNRNQVSLRLTELRSCGFTSE